MKTFSTILITILLVCTVTAEAQTINDLIIDKMFAENKLDTAKYEIEILSNRLKQIDLTNAEISLRPLSIKEPIGLYTVVATLFNNGKEIESSQVRMRIKKFDVVLVSRDKLKRHNQLNASNTTIKRIEVTNLRSKAFLSVEETEGYRLKSTLLKGLPITTNMLEKIPDIISGRETTIVYSGGIFKVTADGIALQSGSEGDFIKVKNKTSKKIIVARVIDSRHVAVDP